MKISILLHLVIKPCVDGVVFLSVDGCFLAAAQVGIVCFVAG